MKINANNTVNAINAYRTVEKNKSKNSVAERKTGSNSDRVEFVSENTLKGVKAEIVNSVEKEVPVSRLEQLSRAYADENCPVGADVTAAYILGVL